MSTAPQHMAALRKANRIRIAQAAVKREVASGTLSLADALVDPRARTMTIGRVLGAQRRYGPATVQRALLLASILVWGPLARPMMETRTVKSLDPRARRALVQACRGGGR